MVLDSARTSSSPVRSPIRISAKGASSLAKSLTVWVYTHWVLVLVVGSWLIPPFVDPPVSAIAAGQELGMNLASPTEFFLSPIFLTCVILTVYGTISIHNDSCALARAADPATERMLALWHLTNSVWWSGGCDVLSGLFAVMPRMNIFYLAVDSKHYTGGNAARSTLDTVYLCELLIHVPLSWLCYRWYLQQHPARHVLEGFVAGVQLLGCVAYYCPELLEAYDRGTFEGGHWPWDDNILFFAAIFMGAMWVIVPALMLYRLILIHSAPLKSD